MRLRSFQTLKNISSLILLLLLPSAFFTHIIFSGSGGWKDGARELLMLGKLKNRDYHQAKRKKQTINRMDTAIYF